MKKQLKSLKNKKKEGSCDVDSLKALDKNRNVI